MDQHLIEAYRATIYKVVAPTGSFELRIGIRSPELAGLHERCDVSTSAFLTAWNPGSRFAETSENKRAQAQMEAELREAGCTLLDGIGLDPSGNWPGEPSVLALGISREQAQLIGRKYGQNAVVYMADNAVPGLLLIQ